MATKEIKEATVPVWPTQPMAMDLGLPYVRKARTHLFNLGLIDSIDYNVNDLDRNYSWEFLKICFAGLKPWS